MSIQSEIERINLNISNSYSAVSEMGGTMPSEQNSNNLAGAVRSIPQGPTYTAGKGIQIEDDTISVETPITPITEEEYDALTEDEKNSDVAWLITDGGTSSGNFVTVDQMNDAINEAITGAMEEAY